MFTLNFNFVNLKRDKNKINFFLLKGYVKSMKSFGNLAVAEEEGQRGCAERALCEASAECIQNAQGTSSIFCQLGSYVFS